MSWSGDNYRELLDGQGTLNLEPCLLGWKYNLTNLNNYIYTLNELIDIRDGIKECNGLTKVDISQRYSRGPKCAPSCFHVHGLLYR